jgi:hypothetical protein
MTKGIRVITSQIWIVVSIIALAVVAFLVFSVAVGKGRKRNTLTPLAGVAFAFVLAGIMFGNDRLIGYSLFGVGVIFSFADIYRRSKSK